MKQGIFSIFLLITAVFTANCSNTNNSASGGFSASGYVTPTVAYTISQAFSQGVDDHGNMWIEIDGSFGAAGNTVSITCDGTVIYSTIESQTSSQVVASVAAASYYNDCSISVQSGGEVSQQYDTGISAMILTGTSHQLLNANPSLINIELDGNFIVAPLTSSVISVLTTCDGGNTYFSANVISLADNALVVSVANPGTGLTSACAFTVQDTFQNLKNNTEVVSSLSLISTINGI